MKNKYHEQMERINIDEALENAGKNLKEELSLFSHALLQISMITGSAITITWGLISNYNQTALLALPMIVLFLAEDYLWKNQNRKNFTKK